jgi:hypothetical protein
LFHVYGRNGCAVGVLEEDFSFAVHASSVEVFVDVGSVFHVAVRGQDGAGGSWSMEHGPVGGCIVVGNDFEDTGADGYTGWFMGGFFSICCDRDGSFEELVIPDNGG